MPGAKLAKSYSPRAKARKSCRPGSGPMDKLAMQDMLADWTAPDPVASHNHTTPPCTQAGSGGSSAGGLAGGAAGPAAWLQLSHYTDSLA